MWGGVMKHGVEDKIIKGRIRLLMEWMELVNGGEI
jgi:hypothetical protein